MGYLGNQLATVATGAFAAVLTGLWPWFMGFAPVLNFIFIMAVTITWFLTFACWFSQKSADYMKAWEHAQAGHGEKSATNEGQVVQVFEADGSAANDAEISEAKIELNNELDQLRATVKIKDSEIEHLKAEIANLETRVQIESLKTELTNLKALASGR